MGDQALYMPSIADDQVNKAQDYYDLKVIV